MNCDRCESSEGEHFPFAGTGLLGVVRKQGSFSGMPGSFCPIAPRNTADAGSEAASNG